MVSYFERTIGRAAREAPVLTARFEAWTAVDWAIAVYATYVAVVAVVFRETVAQWPSLLVWHAALVLALLLLPPRGAAWEQTRARRPCLAHVAATHGAVPAIHLSRAAPDAVLRGGGAHRQRGVAGLPVLVRVLPAGRGPRAVRRHASGPALAGRLAAARRSDARLLLRLLPADHLRHRDRLAWVGPARNPGAGVPYGDDLHDARILPVLHLVSVPAGARAVGTFRDHDRPAAIRGLGVHACDRGDHRRRGRVGWMFPECARVRHVGTHVWTRVLAPEDRVLVRAVRARSQRGLRLHPVPPRRRCLRRPDGGGGGRGSGIPLDPPCAVRADGGPAGGRTHLVPRCPRTRRWSG